MNEELKEEIQSRKFASIMTALFGIAFIAVIAYALFGEKDPKDSQIQKLETYEVFGLVRKVKGLPDSAERDAFLSYVNDATSDDIITYIEYHEIKSLASEVDISNYTTKIKTLASE